LKKYYLRVLGIVAGSLTGILALIAVVWIAAGSGESGGDQALVPTPTPVRPAATPTRPPVDPTVSPSRTPEPASPIPIPAGCSYWPEAVHPVIEKLDLPAAICLKIVDDLDELPQSCGDTRACYTSADRTVWKLTDEAEEELPNSPLRSFTADFVLAHELCHAHQHWQVIKEPGLGAQFGLSNWVETPEGRAFIQATAGLPPNFIPLGGGVLENFANVCAAWLLPTSGLQQQWVDAFPSVQRFVRAWLAK